jgi:hypothetical protein
MGMMYKGNKVSYVASVCGPGESPKLPFRKGDFVGIDSDVLGTWALIVWEDESEVEDKVSMRSLKEEGDFLRDGDTGIGVYLVYE